MKRFRRLTWLFCLSLVAVLRPEELPEPPPKEGLRVATYNLRNYLSMDRLVEGRYRLDYPKREIEKAVVRETILALEADVLAVQEVGSQDFLRELREDLARDGLVYHGMALVRGEDQSRMVGALWREDRGFSVESLEHVDLDFTIFGEASRVKRGMLELRVRIASTDQELALFALHLKSKYTDDERDPQSSLRRAGEAQAARDRILRRCSEPSRNMFVIAGDLNDGPHSSAVRRFLSKGEVQISRLQDHSDHQKQIWTHFYEKGAEYSRIDYLLVSPGLEAVAVLNGGVYWHEDFFRGSDHRPVWMDIRFPK
ncbi:endonuclease/exonuclease/phosphatase family protein [Pelagicoccus sp. SDUM812003]|uniref:endonuclease/exonuclease/phosphatase family protein n=1 Tax=Pelagicoccus sp. SDUM812003 TaxID=3041267 RepID=UPI00280F8101|nr:endonuclease/exonuclease/phosphatase family protein [Pelagicoccus sp. SDUM812003]MDQ8203069.1 endonuclease/exonuclease/phosphatase family protein [Pelagicoccus sp. SDUM812003]